MKRSALTLLAFLAMASIVLATPVLGIIENGETGAGSGLYSYTLTATGTGITTLSKFQVTSAVNQVFAEDPTWGNWIQTEWSGGSAPSAPGDAEDSFVIFGDQRIPGASGETPDIITLETIGGNPDPPVGTGSGSLDNYRPFDDNGTPEDEEDDTLESWDAYLRNNAAAETGDPPEVDVPLMQLVTDSASYDDIALTLTLYTGTDFNPATGAMVVTQYDLEWPSGIIPPTVELGNTNGYIDPTDTDIDLSDLANFGLGWFGPDGDGYVEGSGTTTLAEWLYGDFSDPRPTGNGTVDLTDLADFGTGWFGPNGDGYTGGAVPEPSTIVMLILGALCLVGYRVRK